MLNESQVPIDTPIRLFLFLIFSGKWPPSTNIFHVPLLLIYCSLISLVDYYFLVHSQTVNCFTNFQLFNSTFG